MSDQLLTIDRQPLVESFQLWREENGAINSELAESMAALEAYQAHLDQWQQELATQRSAIEQERQQFEQTRDTLAQQELEIERLKHELECAQEEIRDMAEAPPVASHNTTTSDPVLGSVLAQFDKLRQQQSRERKERMKQR